MIRLKLRQCYSITKDFKFQVKFEDKWGYVDQYGEWVIEPKFSGTEDFVNGVAVSCAKWTGCINIFGEWIIGPTLNSYDYKTWKNTPSAIRHKNKWGIISAEGDWTLKPIYDSIGLLSPGLFLIKKDGNHGIADFNGRIVLKCTYINIFKPVNDLICANAKGHGYIFNRKGELLQEIPYWIKYVIKSGIVVTEKNGDGFIDFTGKEILKTEYRIAWAKNDTVVIKNDKNKIGCYDALSGECIAEPIYDDISEFKHGAAITTMQNCK